MVWLPYESTPLPNGGKACIVFVTRTGELGQRLRYTTHFFPNLAQLPRLGDHQPRKLGRLQSGRVEESFDRFRPFLPHSKRTRDVRGRMGRWAGGGAQHASRRAYCNPRPLMLSRWACFAEKRVPPGASALLLRAARLCDCALMFFVGKALRYVGPIIVLGANKSSVPDEILCMID